MSDSIADHHRALFAHHRRQMAEAFERWIAQRPSAAEIEAELNATRLVFDHLTTLGTAQWT